MSRIGTPSGQATVASRTTFEALTVDSGEDSEEEQVAAQPTPPPERSVCKLLCAVFLFMFCPYSEPLKPSKSALKKAAKTARTERRQQQKATKNHTSESLQGDSSASESPIRPPAAYEPIKVPHMSYEIIPATPESSKLSQDASGEIAPLPEPTPSQISGSVKYDDIFSSPEPSYPTSMETSGRNSPDPLEAGSSLHDDALNQEIQLALQNKLDQQQAAERTKKKQNAITRTFWGLVMIGGFVGKFVRFRLFMSSD
jgi:phosphatidate cytidylyltransferase